MDARGRDIYEGIGIRRFESILRNVYVHAVKSMISRLQL
jgi:hypothetical protein